MVWSLLFCVAGVPAQADATSTDLPLPRWGVPATKDITHLSVYGGRVWAGTKGDGVYARPASGDAPFSKDQTAALSDADMTGGLCTGPGGLYAGTKRGLYRWASPPGAFEPVPLRDGQGRDLGTGEVYSIAARGGRLAACVRFDKDKKFYTPVVDAPGSVARSVTDRLYDRLEWDAAGDVLYGLHHQYGIYAHPARGTTPEAKVVKLLEGTRLFTRQRDRYVFPLGWELRKQVLATVSFGEPDSEPKRTIHPPCQFNAMQLDDHDTLWISSSAGLWRLGAEETEPVQLTRDGIGALCFHEGRLYFVIGNDISYFGGVGGGRFEPAVTKSAVDRPGVVGQPLQFEVTIGFDEPQLLSGPPEVRISAAGGTAVKVVSVEARGGGKYLVTTEPVTTAGGYDLLVTLANVDGKAKTVALPGALRADAPISDEDVSRRVTGTTAVALAIALGAVAAVAWALISPRVAPLRRWAAYRVGAGDWVVRSADGCGLWVSGDNLLRSAGDVRTEARNAGVEFVFVRGTREHFTDSQFYAGCNTVRGVEFVTGEDDRVHLSLTFADDAGPAGAESHDVFRRQLGNKIPGRFRVGLVGSLEGRNTPEREGVRRRIRAYCELTRRYGTPPPETIFGLFARTARGSRNAEVCDTRASDSEAAFWSALWTTDIVFVAAHGTADTLDFHPTKEKVEVITTKQLADELLKNRDRLRAKLIVFCSCLVGTGFITPLLDAGVTCVAARVELELDFLVFYGTELLHRLVSLERYRTGTLADAHAGAIAFVAEKAGGGRARGQSQQDRFAEDANALYIYGYSQMTFEYRFRGGRDHVGRRSAGRETRRGSAGGT